MLKESCRALTRRIATVARNAFALVGIAAIGLIIGKMLFPSVVNTVVNMQRDSLATKEIAGTAPALDAALSAAIPVALQTPDPRVEILASYIARNYRVARDAARDLVGIAFDAAKGYSVDPLVVLSVIAIESRFNPIAESDMGAKGLMQVIPKYHPEKFEIYGGEERALDTRTNILVGAQILQEYIGRAGGLSAGLQWYNGAAHDASRQYAEKVLGEYDRLAAILGRRPARREPNAVAVGAT